MPIQCSLDRAVAVQAYLGLEAGFDRVRYQDSTQKINYSVFVHSVGLSLAHSAEVTLGAAEPAFLVVVVARRAFDAGFVANFRLLVVFAALVAFPPCLTMSLTVLLEDDLEKERKEIFNPKKFQNPKIYLYRSFFF